MRKIYEQHDLNEIQTDEQHDLHDNNKKKKEMLMMNWKYGSRNIFNYTTANIIYNSSFYNSSMI